jgi:hypothetical protein
MKTAQRIILATTGIASWLAGGIATFTATDGGGAAALIAAGVAATLLALIGYWPSRIGLSGNEFSWDEVVETVDEQIDAAEDAGETAAVRELEDLRKRLFHAQRTGSVPMHPAAEYEEALQAALRRMFPGLPMSAAPGRSRDQADFELTVGDGTRLLVETKYKTDPQRPFRGSTLGPLWSRVGSTDRLLVVTNALNVDDAQEAVGRAVGSRGRLISWSGPRDDDALRAAASDLLS